MPKFISKNFSFKQPVFKDGETIEGINLSQDTLTEIGKGVKNLTFKGSNLTRCKLPKDAITINCNTFQGPKIPEPPLDPDKQAKNAIFRFGEEKILDLIGKEAAKSKFNLKDF